MTAPPRTDPRPVRTLDPTEAAQVRAVANRFTAVANGNVDDPRWVAAARAAWPDLPAAFRRTLTEFRRDPGRSGTLLIRGLPVDEPTLPPTPRVLGSVQREATIPAAVLLMTATALGDPVAFHAEKGGALVQDVVPVPGHEGFQGNAGSSTLLDFHNENAFHPHRPDFVLLLCLRPDHEGMAGTTTACVRMVLPLLTAASREALSRPEFATAAPPSFGYPEGNGETPRHAVLSGASDDPDIRVDLAATKALTPAGEKALRELGEVFTRVATTNRLAAGDLAIVDNRITVHGRSAFQPRYDGRDRWLQRSFVLTDLRRSRAWRSADGYVLG
ncbi:clavaminate synthase family protein [Kibdelosporangium lantanae]